MGVTPEEFRKHVGHQTEARFASDLLQLLDDFHTDQRKIGFYADKLNMSIKGLSKKVREEFQMSLGQFDPTTAHSHGSKTLIRRYAYSRNGYDVRV